MLSFSLSLLPSLCYLPTPCFAWKLNALLFYSITNRARHIRRHAILIQVDINPLPCPDLLHAIPQRHPPFLSKLRKRTTKTPRANSNVILINNKGLVRYLFINRCWLSVGHSNQTNSGFLPYRRRENEKSGRLSFGADFIIWSILSADGTHCYWK